MQLVFTEVYENKISLHKNIISSILNMGSCHCVQNAVWGGIFFLLNVFLQKPENAMRFLGQLMTGPFCHCTWQKAIVGVSFRKLHQNCKSTVGLNAQWKHTLVLIEDIQVLHLHLGGVTIALIARGNGTNTWRAVSFTVQTPDPV